MSYETLELFQCKFPFHIWLIYLTYFSDKSSTSTHFEVHYYSEDRLVTSSESIKFFFAFSRGCFHFSKIYCSKTLKRLMRFWSLFFFLTLFVSWFYLLANSSTVIFHRSQTPKRKLIWIQHAPLLFVVGGWLWCLCGQWIRFKGHLPHGWN